MKKFYSLLLMLLVAVMSANATITIASGDGWKILKYTDQDFSQSLVGKKVLWISKGSAVQNYSKAVNVPWHSYRDQVDLIYTSDQYTGTNRIGSYCFCDMPNLTEVHLWINVNNTSNYTIGAHAFENCPNLEKVTGCGRCTNFGDYAFNGCSKLDYVSVCSNELTYIGSHAFNECTVFRGLYYSPSSGAYSLTIGDYAFAKCALTGFNADVVTTIGEYAFANCPMTDIELPRCTSIGDRAFNQCKLTYVRLYSTLNSIGTKAFYSGLEDNGSFVITANPAPTTASDAFLYCNLSTITLQTATNATGYNVAPWNQFKEYEADAELYVVVSGTTLTMYYDGQCYSRGGGINYQNMWNVNVNDLKQVTKVVIDQSVASARPTSTVNWFYYWFENLTTIEGIEYLNTSEVEDMSNMFNGCKKLKAIDVSHFNTSKCTDMGSMFCGCAALTELNVNSFDVSKVTNALTMFAGCTNLQRIYCEKDWTSLGNNVMYWAFNNCTSLTGGWGTPYDQSYRDAQYARPDGGSNAPGYFWRQDDTGQEPEPVIEPTDPEQPDLCEVFGVGDFEFVTGQMDDSQFGEDNMLSYVFYTEEGWYISTTGDLVMGSDNGTLLLLTIYPDKLTDLRGIHPANDNCRLMVIEDGDQSVTKAVSGEINISVDEESETYTFVYRLTMNDGNTISGVITGVCADEIDPEQAVENVQSDNVQSTKVIRDGMLFIERNGKTYNAQGVEMK